MKTLLVFFTQICDKFTHLYAFIHNGIYTTRHTGVIRQI